MTGLGALPEAAVSLGSRIGRYFGLISFLPSALVVSYLFALTRSGAWTGSPDWALLLDRLSALEVIDIALLLLVSLALAVLVHPLQFPFTQLLEGYWGTSALARQLAVLRIGTYREHLASLEDDARHALIDLVRSFRGLPDSVDGRASAAALLRDGTVATDDLLNGMNSRSGDDVRRIRSYWHFEQAERAKGGLPLDRARTMPTRLGNALRRYEDVAGDRYQLDALAAVPRLALVAQPPDIAYLEDTRQGLDLSVRMCLVATIATAVSVAALATDGLWLLLALVPYMAAYASYLGAVAAAHEYGTAMCAVVGLNRFALYERLRLPQPAGLAKEREDNVLLSRLLGGDPVGTLEATKIVYVHQSAEVKPNA